MQTENIVDKRIHWKRLNDDVSVGHFSSCSPSIGHNASQVYVKSHQALGLDSEKSIKVFLLHDIGQHHGRYQSFIDWARRENPAISFVAMDFVGHGLSSGTRGHFEKFDHLVNDFHFLLTQMEKKSDDSEKWIVIGHGLGGLVALDLVNRFQDSKEHRIDGLVLSNFIFQLSSLVFQLEDQMLLDKSTIRKIIGHTRPVRPFKSEEILSAPEDVLNY
ncbi:MAG: alpha/beta hydrolase [Bacteriovorax sp.]